MSKYYIRSFVKRSRKLSNNQINYINKYSHNFLIPYTKNNLILENIFNRKTKTILEIGFGSGNVSAKIATFMHTRNFICVEVYEKGILNLLKIINIKSIKNIKIIKYDIINVLNYMIKPYTLFGIHIFFPDPWIKIKYRKRRLIKKKIIKLIIFCLNSGGYLHIVTDCSDYAKNILNILNSNIFLRNISYFNNFIDDILKPNYRFVTKFEKKNLILKKKIFDLIFIKI